MSDLTNTGSPLNPPRSGEGSGKSGVSLTDAEVICSWMEPKPVVPMPPFEFWQGKPSAVRWWRLYGISIPVGHEASGNGHLHWLPRELTLNECHEVEARLQEGARLATGIEPCILRNRYIAALSECVGTADLWHASAEQKIKALAATLRSRVLPGDETGAPKGLSGGGR